jgi:hypothetical protein
MVVGICILGLTGCSLPQVSAEDRLFLSLDLQLLDVFTLPKQDFEDTPVGGLSALAYDANRDRFYALSDDRGGFAPPRFYTFKVETDFTHLEQPVIQAVDIESVTFLKDAAGEVYTRDRLDSEGMALSPRQTLLISSEGVAASQTPPAINEYDLETGRLKTEFRLPERFISDATIDNLEQTKGIRDNLGFEAMALGLTSSAGAFEPFRLFFATESALAQDFNPDPTTPLISRFLHYLIGPEQSTFISEYAYPLALEPLGTVVNGLSELLAIDQAGHFLSLERVFSVRGFEINLFQLATGGAVDISTLATLPDVEALNPIQKQPLLDFSTLDAPVAAVDNLEAMTFGPPLPDGTATLWFMSDDNFSADQVTQLWVFRFAIA